MDDTLFLSYRRSDSGPWVARLAADLSKRFGDKNVFFDIRQPAGANYIVEIDRRLEEATCVLVVIGPNWLNTLDDSGTRQIDKTDDLVRKEVALALRCKSHVVPVLVGRASMPSATLLPSDLRELTTRQAAELTDSRWPQDVQQLIVSLAGKVWWKAIALSALGVMQLGFIGLWIFQIGLQNKISGKEQAAAQLRDNFIAKMQVGTDECMAGRWPPGALKGPSYHNNGNMVTEVCSGVSASLDYFQSFFNDEQLWRMNPSPQAGARFAATYDSVFENDFNSFLTTGFTVPRSPTARHLAEEARAEIAGQAKQVVDLKQADGKNASELATVQQYTRAGLYWTVLVGLAFILWFARYR